MKTRVLAILAISVLSCFSFVACNLEGSQATKETQAVLAQQTQYSIGQPVPRYDWSLERDLLIQLYNLRNQKVATHAVWRSDYGMIEYDCPAMGYGLPYDMSLTNPLMATDEDQTGFRNNSLAAIGQAEPNGVFASTNTSATWVMCVAEGGMLEPVYIEAKVTVFPFPVTVDYANNRVKRAGAASVTITTGRPVAAPAPVPAPESASVPAPYEPPASPVSVDPGLGQ